MSSQTGLKNIQSSKIRNFSDRYGNIYLIPNKLFLNSQINTNLSILPSFGACDLT